MLAAETLDDLLEGDNPQQISWACAQRVPDLFAQPSCLCLEKIINHGIINLRPPKDIYLRHL